MKELPTYRAEIFCGLNPGYKTRDTERDADAYGDVHEICRNYCDEIGLGVTLSETMFIYTGGYEPGIIVGLINYPRFPKANQYVQNQAITLARILGETLGQERVSVVCSDKTIMLERGIDYAKEEEKTS